MKEEDKLREINSLSEQTSSGDGSSAESCMLESEYERLEKEGKIKNRVYVCGLGWMLPTVVVYGCGCGYGEEDDVYGGEEYGYGYDDKDCGCCDICLQCGLPKDYCICEKKDEPNTDGTGDGTGDSTGGATGGPTSGGISGGGSSGGGNSSNENASPNNKEQIRVTASKYIGRNETDDIELIKTWLRNAGYTNPDNSTPWCAAFAYNMFLEAGYEGYKSASVREWRSHYGEFVVSPEVGDVAFFPNMSHIGIVTNVTNDTITVIHGNWSNKVSETTHNQEYFDAYKRGK